MSTRPARVGLAGLLLAGLVGAPLPGTSSAAGAAPEPDGPRLSDSSAAFGLEHSLEHLSGTSASVPAGRWPGFSVGGHWGTTPRDAWTSGFLPGELWAAYQATGDPTWAARARAREAGLAPNATLTGTHDLGFMVQDSFGAGYRLTGDPAARALALQAAQTLARRFVPSLGVLRAHDLSLGPDRPLATNVPVIIDTMMNLELLLWADQQPEAAGAGYGAMALQHALTTLQDHVDPDGTVQQLVVLNPDTGAVQQTDGAGGAHSGRSDPAWARGQAWAVHGYTAVYAATHDPRMLSTARTVADRYLRDLPADGIPRYHLDRPAEPLDSSAAAIAASGLLHLATLEPDPQQAARWQAAAERALLTLSTRAYAATPEADDAAVLHATYNLAYPSSVDTGIIWGDYYYLEALLRRRLLPPAGPALPASASQPATTDGDSGTAWSPTVPGSATVLDLGASTPVGTLSVDWQPATGSRFAVDTSADGSTWRRVLTAVSAGRPGLESYDLQDSAARWVRLVVLQPAAGAGVRELAARPPAALTGPDTAVALTAPARVEYDAALPLTAHVQDAAGGPAADQAVEGWLQAPGAADSARAGSTTTGADGAGRWAVRLHGTTAVRAVLRGSTGQSPAVSDPVLVTVVPAGTTARVSASPARLHRGAVTIVSARLLRRDDARFVAGQRAVLQQRLPGQSTWRPVAEGRTDAHGLVSVRRAPTSTVTYRWVVTGSAAYATSTSPWATVTVAR